MNNIKFEDYVYYDETSPTCLRWKINKNSRARKDGVAGTTKREQVIRINNQNFTAAQIVWSIHKGKIPFKVHHLDYNSLNNKISNLSLTAPVNQRQQVKPSKNNSTGLIGISFDNRKAGLLCVASWVQENGKQKHQRFSVNRLGIMQAVKEAVLVRNKYNRKKPI